MFNKSFEKKNHADRDSCRVMTKNKKFSLDTVQMQECGIGKRRLLNSSCTHL